MENLARRYEKIDNDTSSRARNNSDRAPSEDPMQEHEGDNLNLGWGLEESGSDHFESNGSNTPELIDYVKEGKKGINLGTIRSTHEFQQKRFAKAGTRDGKDKGKALYSRNHSQSCLQAGHNTPNKSFTSKEQFSKEFYRTPKNPGESCKVDACKHETKSTKDCQGPQISDVRKSLSRNGVGNMTTSNVHFVPHGRASRKCSQHSGSKAHPIEPHAQDVQGGKNYEKSSHGHVENSNSNKESNEVVNRAASGMKSNDLPVDLHDEKTSSKPCNEESPRMRTNGSGNHCKKTGGKVSSAIDTGMTNISQKHRFDMNLQKSDKGRFNKHQPNKASSPKVSTANMEENGLKKIEGSPADEGNEIVDEGDGGGDTGKRISRYNCYGNDQTYGGRRRHTQVNEYMNRYRRNYDRDLGYPNQRGREYFCKNRSGYHGYGSQNMCDRGYESEYGGCTGPPSGRGRDTQQTTNIVDVDRYRQELPAPSYGRGRRTACEDTYSGRNGVFQRNTSSRDDCCVGCPDRFGSRCGRGNQPMMRNRPASSHGYLTTDAQCHGKVDGCRYGNRYGTRFGSGPGSRPACRYGSIDGSFGSRLSSRCSSRQGSGHSSKHCSRLASRPGSRDCSTSGRGCEVGGYDGSRAGSPTGSDWKYSQSLSPCQSWNENRAASPQDKPYPANWRTFGRRPPAINEFRPLGKARLKNVRPAGKQTYLARVSDEKAGPGSKSDLWDICYGLAKPIRDQWTQPLPYGTEVTRTGDIDPCFQPSRGDIVVINPAQNFYRAMRTGYILTYKGADYTFGVGDLILRLGRFSPRSEIYVPYASLELYMHTESREKRFLGRQPPISVDFNYYNLDYESPGKYLKVGSFLNERLYPRRGDIIIQGGAWSENFPNVARKYHSCVKYWIPNMEFFPNDMLVRPYVDLGKAIRDAEFYWGAAELYTYSGKGLGWAYWGRDEHIFDTPFCTQNEHGIKTGHYKNEVGHYHRNDNQNLV